MSIQLTDTRKVGHAAPSVFRIELPSVWNTLGSLRGVFTIWRQRRHYRWELSQLAKEGPHLIDDIGLTLRQVQGELEKPFWQA